MSEKEKTLVINRKLWVALANDQLKQHKRFMGSYAKPCETCLEILMCEGPIGIGICSTLHQMQDDGVISGVNKIPFSKLRRKYLPVSENCLIAYGLLKKPSNAIEKELR
jgi:hypothetical protein